MIKQLFRITLDHPLLWLWLLLSGLFLLFFLIQIIYFFRYYIKLLSHKKLNIKTSTDPVSVIICVKNEAENLKKFLPSILNQFYPDFEVIVVNDGSTDQTEEVLAEFKRIYPHLYVTGIEGGSGHISGKKVAQTLGIKAAHHEQLVFTDADCEPKSPNWIRHMQSNFMQKTDIVIGYGGYKARKGLLNKWIRIDYEKRK
jgi:glycosyltransferase involved in cell wall biosynthesis